MLYKEFYSELGKLLYAIADVDKVITMEEKKELQKIVKKELAPFENHVDEFGTDAAYYSEIEFDYNDEQIIDVESALNSFIDFVEDHHTAFDEKMKQVCLHIVNEIAAAYHGSNRKEKALIKTLRDKLKKIEVKKYNFHKNETGIDPLLSAEPAFDYIEDEMITSDEMIPDETIDPFSDIIDEHLHGFEEDIIRRNKSVEKSMGYQKKVVKKQYNQ